MYFVFKPARKIWRNQLLQAVLRTDLPPFHEIKPDWWLAQSIQTPLPKMVFAINKRAPILDNYKTDWGFDLYSERLIHLISDEAIAFETFPAELIDYKTEEVFAVKYYVFHLLEMRPCADIDASEKGPLVLTDKCLQADHPLFRLAEGIQLVLIHEKLRTKLEMAQVTGCHYESLSEYRKVPLFPPHLP